ncbi:MAG: hypothetical protein IE927_08865 [Rhodobacterales bacterium]|nr:hypothetical protein [Rhodobacterales bacterium]
MGDCAQRDAAGNCLPLAAPATDTAAVSGDCVKSQDTADCGPARVHKDDGVKYGDRTTDQTAGKNGGATASDDDGATGGTATHTRGDSKGGGVGGNMGPSN